MSEFLSGMIASVSANTFSDLFIYAIGGVFVLGLCLALLGKASGFVSGAPNLMTSLGILGTFAGIVVGLMEFDPQNIDGSIGLLLTGLKTAFLTSLVGMCATILFKLFTPFIQKEEQVQDGAIGPDDIYSVMNQQLNVTQALVDSIRGDEDSSLSSQVRLLRSDVNDGNKLIKGQLSESNESQQKIVSSLVEMQSSHTQFSDRLWLKMDEFGEMLSKSATEQVINALKEVITDFNNSLTEQFGENFKRLDESVKKLVDWQENYRTQLEEMAHKYQLGVDAISSTEKSVAHISERADAIPTTMEKLHSVMELGHAQVLELEERLEAFKELRDQAVEAMPQIKQQLDETMSVIGQSVESAATHYEQMLGESKAMMDSFVEGHKSATAQFNESAVQNIQFMNAELKSTLTQASEDLLDSVDSIGDALIESTDEAMGKVTKAIEATSDTYVRMATETNATIDKFGATNTETLRVANEHVKEVITETQSLVENFTNTHGALTQQFEQSARENITAMATGVKEAVHDFSEEVTESIEAIGDTLIEKTDSAMGKVTQAVDMTNETYVRLATEANATIDKYSETNSETLRVANEHVKEVIVETQSLIENYAETHTEMTAQLEASTTKNVTMMNEGVKGAVDVFTEEVTGSIEVMGSKLIEQTENSMAKVTQAVDMTNETYVRLATEANTTIDKYSETNSETLRVANEHVKEVIAETQSLIENYTETHTKLTAQLEASTAKNVTMMNEGVKGAVDVFTEEVTGSIEVMGSKLIEQTEAAMSKVEDSVKQTSVTFDKMNAESNQMIEQYGQEFREALETFTSSAMNSIQSMRTEIGEGASAISEEMKQGAHELSEKLAQSADDISSNIGLATHGLNAMSEHIAQRASEIQEHLRAAMGELNNNISDMVNDLNRQAKETSNILVAGNEQLAQQTKQTQESVFQGIAELQNRLEGVLEEVFEAQVREIKRTFESLEEQIIESVGQTGQAVEKQVEVLDLQMQQEINRVINEMGQGLASVTQQFTRDYTKLTNEMKSVIQSVNKMAV